MSLRPDTERDYRSDHAVHEGRRQTSRRSAHAGNGLKLIDASGRSRLICQPSSRTGENPPYGMIGRIEETSASFEARSAPRSHPTNCDIGAHFFGRCTTRQHLNHCGSLDFLRRGDECDGEISSKRLPAQRPHGRFWRVRSSQSRCVGSACS